MARIDGIGDRDAGFLTRQVFGGARRMTGQVPDPLRIMAHSTSLMWANGLFELVARRGTEVEGRLKALAGIKAAAMVGCVF